VNRLNLRIARKRKTNSALRTYRHTLPTWKTRIKSLVRYSRMIYIMLGLILAAIAYVFELPSRIVEFGDSYPKAQKYLYEKAYSPLDWTGIFDTFPEGFVDYNDMGISSPVKAALDISVYDGNRLEGTIWWQGSCSLGLPYQGILIDGEIKLGGTTAIVEVYDFKDGRRVSFFTGEMRNDGSIIEFSNFPENTALNGSRIAQNPLPATLEHWEWPYCASIIEKFNSTKPLQ
jgi:hypothetical protein